MQVSAADKIYDALLGREIGDLVSYDEILGAVARPRRELETVRKSYYAAAARLRAERLRHMVCVRGQGYRIAHPSEGVNLAKKRHRQGVTRVQDAHAIVRTTDTSLLNHEQTQQSETLGRVLSMMCQAIYHLDGRLVEIEAAQQEDQQLRESQRKETEDRLKRLEQFMSLSSPAEAD